MIGSVFRIFSILLLYSVTFGMRLAASELAIPVEYQVKAAFVNNFIKFVDWPDTAFTDNHSPLIISVLGDTPLTESLKTIEHVQVKGRRLSIRPIKTLQELGASHILFVSSSEKHRVNEILRFLDNMKILTISEIEGFCGGGGIINFTLVNNKVHFEINVEAAQKAGLTISSKLLRLATIVRTQENN
ncbi:MAG: YfiR family protein [Ignavibacteriales bacterium]|nr:YfiR family protein [Ignavibacteriales bacterium]